MKCQSLFWGKNKKDVVNLFAESAKRVVKFWHGFQIPVKK